VHVLHALTHAPASHFWLAVHDVAGVHLKQSPSFAQRSTAAPPVAAHRDLPTLAALQPSSLTQDPASGAELAPPLSSSPEGAGSRVEPPDGAISGLSSTGVLVAGGASSGDVGRPWERSGVAQ